MSVSALLRQKAVKYARRVGTSCNKEAGEVAKQVCVLFNGFLGTEFSSSLEMFHLLSLFHYVWGKPPEI